MKEIEIGSYLFIRIVFNPSVWAVGLWIDCDGEEDEARIRIVLGPFFFACGTTWNSEEKTESQAGFRVDRENSSLSLESSHRENPHQPPNINA